jgi:hypothetical protein
MPIFNTKDRSRRELMRRGEGAYNFYDSCGRAAFDTFRSVVNEWAATMQAQEQAEITRRMQRGNDQQFYAALAELIVHALLINLNHRVVIHPHVPGRKARPDFLVVANDGSHLAYIEVTTFSPASATIASERRADTLYNAVTKAKLPAGCRLHYSQKKEGSRTPSQKQLVGDIELWAHTASHLQSHRFERGGWEVKVTLVTGFKSVVPPSGVILSSVEKARWVSGAQEIREALDEKKSKYGCPTIPYVIVVVDCKDEIIAEPRQELTEAVLGDEVVEEKLSASGTVRPYLIRSGGFWFKGRKPVHTNVSAVLLIPRKDIWHLADPEWQPILALHPWARNPLDPAILPLPRMVAHDDKWTLIQDRSAAEILSLPVPWPPDRS